MARLLTSTLGLVTLTMCLATPVAALTCSQIYGVERLEARLVLLSDHRSEADITPEIDRTLRDLFQTSQALSRTTFKSEDLSEIVGQYTGEISTISQRSPQLGASATAALLADQAHRNTLRLMVLISHDECEFETEPPRASADPIGGGISKGMSPLGNLSASVGLSLAFVLFILIVTLAYLMWQWAALSKLRKMRYVCNVPTEVSFANVKHTLTMQDVSAHGAKLRRIDDVKLEEPVVLKIGTRDVVAKIAWKNTHFVGVQFSKPISIHYVRKMSSNKRKIRIKPR